MRLRNGEHGYGAVTKVLHWVTVAALAAQFAVGYRMQEGDPPDVDCDPPGEGRSGGNTGDAVQERLERREEACEAQREVQEERAEQPVDTALGDLGGITDGGLTLPEWHVVLGLLVLALAVARYAWRATTPLPPWAPALSAGERRLEALLEKALLALLVLIPASGLLLVLASDDWLALHVAAHLAFFLAVALHVGLVLRHTVVRRDRHLQRML